MKKQKGSTTQNLNNNQLFQYRQPVARTQQQQLVQQTLQPDQTVSKKEMRWGAPTWYLLHTLAEKIKDENFQSVRFGLFSIIQTICTNLPCPKCSAHATEYMRKVNFNLINNKNDLQLMLFLFHNEINKRKGYKLFDQNDVSDKYSNANTNSIIHNFFYFFNEKSKNVSMISLNLYRERIIKDLKIWFQSNIQHFDP
jgi:hypothetical protein